VNPSTARDILIETTEEISRSLLRNLVVDEALCQRVTLH